MKDDKCVFCRIIASEALASRVYEDDRILAFMNHRPVHPGECLLIPKEHIDHFTDIDDETAAHIMRTAQKLANNIRKALKPQRVGYVVAGYGVAHAHLIIIPQHHANDITCQHFAVLDNGEIRFSVQHIPLASREELDKVAAKIRL